LFQEARRSDVEAELFHTGRTCDSGPIRGGHAPKPRCYHTLWACADHLLAFGFEPPFILGRITPPEATVALPLLNLDKNTGPIITRKMLFCRKTTCLYNKQGYDVRVLNKGASFRLYAMLELLSDTGSTTSRATKQDDISDRRLQKSCCSTGAPLTSRSEIPSLMQGPIITYTQENIVQVKHCRIDNLVDANATVVPSTSIPPSEPPAAFWPLNPW